MLYAAQTLLRYFLRVFLSLYPACGTTVFRLVESGFGMCQKKKIAIGTVLILKCEAISEE